MPFIKNIPRWLGITAPKWLHQAIARRNMPIMGALAASAIVFAAMLLFYLLTRTPSKSQSLTYSGGYMRGKVSNNDEFRLMLHKADENLMAAKRRGKNQLVGERFE